MSSNHSTFFGHDVTKITKKRHFYLSTLVLNYTQKASECQFYLQIFPKKERKNEKFEMKKAMKNLAKDLMECQL